MDPVSTTVATQAATSLLSRVINYLLHPKTQTITNVTAPLRVTPFYLMEDSIRDYEHSREVTKFASNIFTAHYLMMISALQTSINGVRVVDELNKLNPNMGINQGKMMRKETLMLAEEAFSQEATDTMIGKYLRRKREVDEERRKQERHEMELERAAREAKIKERAEQDRIAREEQDKLEKERAKKSKSVAARQVSDFDQSYGRVLEVDMKIGGDAQKAYVMIGLLPIVIDNDDVFDMLSLTKKDKGFFARFMEWRSGGTSFWEFLSGSDVNREFRNIAKRDKSGYLQAVLSQYLSNRAAMKDSFANDSSILVISKDTVRRLKALLGIDISSPAKRDELLSSLFAMMVIVVDTDTDDIDFYLSGFPKAVSLSIREIKGKNKGDGVDVMSIMSALQKGSVPRF